MTQAIATPPAATPTPAPAAAPVGMFEKPTHTPQPDLQDPPLAEGQQPVKEANKDGQPVTPATEIKVGGRTYKDVAELTKAHEESSSEGLRLYKEQETLRSEMSKRDKAIEALKSELEVAKKTPPFKELNDEELRGLWSEDPVKASKYLESLRDYKNGQERIKSEQEAAKVRSESEKKEVYEYVNARIDAMTKDPKTYPDYQALRPVMDEILEITNGSVGGRKWSADLVYIAALGLKALRSHQAGLSKTQEAEDKAKADATALAAASGGTPAGGSAPNLDDDSDDAFQERLVKSAPKKLF